MGESRTTLTAVFQSFGTYIDRNVERGVRDGITFSAGYLYDRALVGIFGQGAAPLPLRSWLIGSLAQTSYAWF
jgi:hypothetical protein